MVNRSYDIDQLRNLASMVSHASFKRLASSTNQSSYIRKMKKYVGWNDILDSRPRNLNELIEYTYQLLEQNYRHEYIYKNKLLVDFVLQQYSMEDSVLLNEFKIGGSIADAVLINGTDKVFEIKTELDNAGRLNSQLNDYYKAFREVYLFTHHTLGEQYLQVLPSYVGLIVYEKDGQVEILREAKRKSNMLELKAIMASLRKPEYIELTRKVTGVIPEAPAAILYRTCLSSLSDCSIQKVQKAYFEILKSRNNERSAKFIKENRLPDYLQYSIYHQKLNKSSYLRLVNNLNKNL